MNDDDAPDSRQAAVVTVGDRVPQFVLYGADGSSFSSQSLNGQTYILNFFDTGCPDCREELQVLQRIYDKYQASVPVFNVPRSQSRQQVQDYWDKAGLTLPFYTASDQQLYYRFARSVVPRTYVVDAQGVVSEAFDDSPVADFETLDALLQQALGGSEANGAETGGDGMVNLKLRLRVPPMINGIEEYYFHNEYTINRLEVFCFDAETKEFLNRAVVTGLTQSESTYDTEYDITYIFRDLRLRAGIYDIFLIANYDHSPREVPDEDAFLNLVDSITYSDGVEANIPDTGPVMTSCATDLLGVDLIPWVNKDYVLTVEMERVLAKLLIGVSQNAFQLKVGNRKYADINITNYKLVNLNRYYYLFQHRDSLPEFHEQPQFELPYNYSNYVDKDDQYVVDPLFYKKVPGGITDAELRQNYRSWFGAFTTEDFASMPAANNYGYAYVLENTTFKTSQKNGYSPGVVFKAAVNPVFVYLYDGKDNTLQAEYRPEYWPGTIYLYKYNFFESIQAVNLASGLTLDELRSYTDSELKEYGIKQCKFNMGVYETYYTYWIRHRNSPVDMMGPMQYGIVRNNFYKMVVTGVSGLGDSSITPEILRDNYPNSYLDM